MIGKFKSLLRVEQIWLLQN